MPAAGKSPEEWIGQQVVVEVLSEPERQEIARLGGISDWGVTLTYGGDHPLQEPDRDATVFIPWHHVFAMWLAGKVDTEGPPGSEPR